MVSNSIVGMERNPHLAVVRITPVYTLIYAFAATHPSNPFVMAISDTEYQTLCNAAKEYESNDKFGVIEVQKVLEDVFGPHESPRRTENDFQEWKKFWDDLEMWDSCIQAGEQAEKPHVWRLASFNALLMLPMPSFHRAQIKTHRLTRQILLRPLSLLSMLSAI